VIDDESKDRDCDEVNQEQSEQDEVDRMKDEDDFTSKRAVDDL